MDEGTIVNKIDLLFEKVNVRGVKREEASPDPKRLVNGKVTKEYKKEVQDKVDKNTDTLLKELDDLMRDFESFRAKYKKVMTKEGNRRREEGAVRFGGRWTKMGTVHNKIEDLVVSLRKLRDNL